MQAASLPAIKAFIFDLDGTLIDSKLDLVHSVNAMLKELGREQLSVDTIASYIGHGAPQLVASALGSSTTEAERNHALAIFLRHYGDHNLEETLPYSGVPQALEALADFPMAVLTNKPLEMSLQILDGLRLARYFRGIYGGDSFKKKKPNPEGAIAVLGLLGTAAKDAAMVGDSDVDIQTARNTGMLAVGVTYGFGQHDPQSCPADIYLDSLRELVPLAIKP